MEHLTVTCVKSYRGFLQIYGHKKTELLNQLNAEISSYQPSIKRIANKHEPSPNLEFDTYYLVNNNNNYLRCTVREKRPNNKAIIELIDYGSEAEVDANAVSTI